MTRCHAPLVALMLLPVPLFAAETTTFTYDELGRLISSSNASGPRNGRVVSTAYDPAGNRTGHANGQALPNPGNSAVFSISGPSGNVSEGEAAVFTVNKTGTVTSTLTVNYATANGTAVAPSDYTASIGTLSFLAWETAKQVSVAIPSDGAAEGVEQFSMGLSGPSAGASVGTASATATINASTGSNQPPVANPDFLGNLGKCETAPSINVVANDTDPENNLPLALTAVGTSPLVSAALDGSTNIFITAGSATGSGNVSYTVRDSLGATANGVVTFTIVNGPGCN